jgi:hypothetical protein
MMLLSLNGKVEQSQDIGSFQMDVNISARDNTEQSMRRVAHVEMLGGALLSAHKTMSH